MRLSTVLSAAVATAPMLASAAGNLGFAVGNKQPDGKCKEQEHWEADMKAIKASSGSTMLRIYASSDCDTAANILPAAKRQGFRVVLGIWPDTAESYRADKAAAVEQARLFPEQVYAVTVGSESLYRGNFTGEQLVAKIREVRSALPEGVKVGTADSWNKYQDGTADALVREGGADILLCNAFSYWQGQEINNATGSFFDDIGQAFGRIQKMAGANDKIELWVGETGWPSAGTTYQAAIPGMNSARKFFSQAVCGMVDWGFNVFSFEAFDEPWKPESIGKDGKPADETHWGVMEADRSFKYSLKCH